MAESTQQRERKDPILARIQALQEADKSKVIKVRSRRVKIRKEYVGHTIGVFNGRDYENVRIQDEMVGRTLGKVAPRLRPTAQSRYLRGSARKMRQVAALIERHPVEDALSILNFTPKKAAFQLAKTLKSAVANKLSLEGTAHLNPEDLWVSRVVIDDAPMAGRIRFRSMGRVYRIRKKYCHLGIYLEQRAGAPTAEETARPAATRKAGETGEEDTAKTAGKKKTGAKTRKPARKVAAGKPARKAGAKKATKAVAAKKKTKAPAKKSEK